MSPVIVFVTIPDENHLALLLPLAAGLVAEGATVYVLGHGGNADRIEASGAAFVDLYGRYPLDAADHTSVPLPSRFVTYAARYADEIAAVAAELEPALLVYDTFAVVGRVVGAMLGLPSVAVSPGHDLDPVRLVRELRSDPRVRSSAACIRAARDLRERYGMLDASPFSYVTGLSEVLNVCLEPAAYLTPMQRASFEPVVYYGSLPAGGRPVDDGRVAARSFGGERRRMSVYLSFGTIVWRYYEREALAALRTLVDLLAEREDVRALVSLGGATLPADAVASLERPNVEVTPWADQWRVLEEADVFVTHNGLASTHEAAFLGVPMLSVPFFWDQPGLAARSRELGIATSLTHVPGGPVVPSATRDALDRLREPDAELQSALRRAQRWERETLAGRDAVHRRLMTLARARLAPV